MQKPIRFTQRTLAALSLAVLVMATVVPVLPQGELQAAQITNRNLLLLPGTTPSDVNGDGLNDGGSAPGATANHLFEFTVESDAIGGGDADLGSIKFEYCTTAAPVPDGIDCDAPAGMDASGASVGAESGAVGFTVSGTPTANEVVITRTVATVTGPAALSYRLDNIVNPANTNETFFVRISTYESVDATGSSIDDGTVAASTAEPIILTGTMPESLVFCTGEEIDTTGGVPDCTTATPGSVSFDSLFSPTDTSTATSQMAASTNAGQGYAISVNGPTLTSGSNEIDPMDDGGNPTPLVLGTSQFGMNLRANTVTDVNGDPLGLDVAPAANTTNYLGRVLAAYAAVDEFIYDDGGIVADSDSDGTDSQIFTSSYVVNVPGSQPAGTYSTTLTYIATATF